MMTKLERVAYVSQYWIGTEVPVVYLSMLSCVKKHVYWPNLSKGNHLGYPGPVTHYVLYTVSAFLGIAKPGTLIDLDLAPKEEL